MSSWRIRGFVLLMDACAVLAVVLLLLRWPTTDWAGVFLLSVLVALAGLTPVRIPAVKTAVAATDPFVYTALAAYGPIAACIVAVSGVLGAAVSRLNRGRGLQFAFNIGNLLLSVAVASLAYEIAGGVPGAGIQQQIGPLLAATTVFFVVNTGFVSAAIVIDTGRDFLGTWRESGLWTAVSAFAGLTLSICLLLALELVGPTGLALGMPPCWLLAAFYRTHKERQEEQQKRLRQTEKLNVRLEEKVAERTVELRRALTGIEEANRSLRTANEQLQAANRAKSEFLANVSHELRTPLNTIIGFSELLRDPAFGELADQQAEFVTDIHESGDHLLRLINDILDLSKLEAGKLELHLEPVEAPRLIRDAVAMLRPQATRKDIDLSVACDDEIQWAELDPGVFRQVLVNLLSNAVKFTPERGRVRVWAGREERDLLVHVEDTGIGIPSADLKKIFDEFYQVDGSYSRSFGGTGLGLALVRRMVEMHGGSVGVQSVPGQGSRFSCRFPGCLCEPARDLAASAVSGLAGAQTQGRTIVVVEDDAMNRKLARNMLRSKGYEVLEASSGEEALSLLHEQPADLVLLDLQLPGMDGLEVARRLKRDPATSRLSLVALTAHVREADEKEALEAGCIGYITKPIRLAQFPGQVASFLATGQPRF